MTAAPWSRQDWKYSPSAKSFREAHGNPLYTMQWHARLQRQIDDAELPVLMRVSAFIDRHGNGNLSDRVVTAMPRVVDADPEPVPVTQTDIVSRLGVSPAAVSTACKTLRERGMLQPDTGDGVLWTNHCVEGELFEGAQRAADPTMPLHAPQDDDGLPNFTDFKATWLSQHPDHVAVKTRLIQERENLRAQVRDLAADIREYDLIELAAYRVACREIERNRRNGDTHSGNGSGPKIHGEKTCSTPNGGAGSVSLDTLRDESVQDSTPPDEANSSVFNEPADVSSKEKTVPSSSSGSDATESATTTTEPISTPQTPDTGERPDSQAPVIAEATQELQTPQSMSDVEFHQALASAFRGAGKPVPTLGQSYICYVDLGSPSARGFLDWLETPYRPGERPLPPKLPGVQHPGVLKALVLEYKSWCAAEPPPVQVPPPPVSACPHCDGSGFPGAKCRTIPEAQRLVADGWQLCTCEIGKTWRELLE